MKRECAFNLVLGFRTCTNLGDVELARQAHEDPFPPRAEVSEVLHFRYTREGQKEADRQKARDFIMRIKEAMANGTG